MKFCSSLQLVTVIIVICNLRLSKGLDDIITDQAKLKKKQNSVGSDLSKHELINKQSIIIKLKVNGTSYKKEWYCNGMVVKQGVY